MLSINLRHLRLLVAGALACTASVIALRAQAGAANGEWRAYGGDTGHTRYAPLDQINAANFSKLTVAWRFKADHLGPRPEFMFESTPVMANGVLYSTAGSRRAVVALDPGNRRRALDAQRARRRARRRRHRGSSPAAAWRTGPTARRSESSTSRRAISWWR